MSLSVGVIGLDGMPMSLLEEAMDKSWMPFLNSIRNRLAWKELDPIIPLTPPSWTSIMTGVNPGKHGIFDFYRYEVSGNELVMKLYNSTDLEHPRIHEMASISGFQGDVFVANPMPGYPIMPTRSRVVSFLYTPKPLANMDRGLGARLAREGWDISIELLKAAGCSRSVEKAVEVLEFYEDMITAVGEDSGTRRLHWFNTSIPDEVLHKCPKALYKTNILARVLSSIDKIIKLMWENYDIFFVVSDHGWSPYEYYVNVNRILFEHGLIKPAEFKGGVSHIRPHMKPQDDIVKLRVPRALMSLLLNNRVRPMARAVLGVPRYIAGLFGKKIVVQYSHGIDYLRSAAYLPPSRTGWYYVIVRDKASAGKVKDILNNTGLRVLEPQEVFNGHKLDSAPGLILLWNEEEGLMAYSGSIHEPRLIRRKTANHGRYGVLVYKREPSIEWLEAFSEKSPRALPNHIVAPLASEIMGIPASSASDSLDLLAKYGGLKPRVYDYSVRWRILKRVSRSL